MLYLKTIKEGIFRVYDKAGRQSMLSRYGIINEGAPCSEVEGNKAISGSFTLVDRTGIYYLEGGKRTVQINVSKQGDGFEIIIDLEKDERLFGLGDSDRTRIMRRGSVADMTIKNVVGYAPMPMMMSSYGWGIFTNCTYTHYYDMGCTDPDKVVITAKKGTLDFYLFAGDSMAKVLDMYTWLTGRPMVMPKFAYGFTFVENERTNARELLGDIRKMRDLDIPCDTFGLEPAWMEKFYDYSTDKKWSQERFYLPYWMPDNQSGPYTFFYPMREMGMQLSLWLCENYDIFWAEEGEVLKNERTDYQDAEILDEHMVMGIAIDEITRQGEPWFEHLKKFVDNGAASFKLDGSTQVLMHPDRLWAGKYLDEEVHNVYPVVMAKQMKNGFAEYTGRRPFVYTAGGYAGTQQYAATWAGDTGGGWKTLISALNLAMCGHTNTSCDLDVTDPSALHGGFLLPWTAQNCWCRWQYAWYLSKEKEDMIRSYAKLRSSLFPYLYSMAHVAAGSGMPIIRPLALVYEETAEFDNVLNLYMLGDSLLVGAFDMHFHLPDGIWIDYWTGEEYMGDIDYKIPEGRGGALFVKKGSVIVTMKPQKYLLEKQHDYIVDVYPGKEASFTLVEDDGFTFDYMEGKVARTDIIMGECRDNSFTLLIKQRQGSFEGRPDNGYDQRDNSIPEIKGIQPVQDMTVIIHEKNVKEVLIAGEAVNITYNDRGGAQILLSAEQHSLGDVSIQVKFA